MEQAPSLQPVSGSLSPQMPLAIAREVVASAPQSELGPMAKAMSGTSDPLGAVAALSPEEKIALFS